MGEDSRVEAILDTIGDEHARRILAAVSTEARSAKELAEECDLSLPTVYRRIEQLDEQGLVEGRTRVGEDGNEFSVYEAAFESTQISLQGNEYDVRINTEKRLPDRFNQLWDDLGTS